MIVKKIAEKWDCVVYQGDILADVLDCVEYNIPFFVREFLAVAAPVAHQH